MSDHDEFKKRVTVYSDTDDVFMTNLAEQLNLSLVNNQQNMTDYVLLIIDNKLHLQGRVAGQVVVICVDFLSGEANYRREHSLGKKQPIARAIGLNKGVKKLKSLKVLDATAGLGGDAFVLACLGCEVSMLERSSIVASLLEDGLRRARMSEDIALIAHRMTLSHIDAQRCFSQLIEPPDVIYLDPMYPARKKSARVKKDMQMLQGLLVHDGCERLLTAALSVAKSRVVVKRPKGAEHLDNLTPTHCIESKKTRYDVYI